MIIVAIHAARKFGTEDRPVQLASGVVLPEGAASRDIVLHKHFMLVFAEHCLGEYATDYDKKTIIFKKMHISFGVDPESNSSTLGTYLEKVPGCVQFQPGFPGEEKIVRKKLHKHVRSVVTFDFGDLSADYRMVTRDLDYQHHQNGLGSIFLPVTGNIFWSPNKENLRKLDRFVQKAHKRNKLVMAVALSLGKNRFLQSARLSEIETEHWAFVLVGVKKPDGDGDLPPDRFFYSDYVEFEDLVRFCDYFVSSGGAGSVSVPLYAGVPQAVLNVDASGGDKSDNFQNLKRLQLVPGGEHRHSVKNFKDLLPVLEESFEEYQTRAVLASQNQISGINGALDVIAAHIGVRGTENHKD